MLHGFSRSALAVLAMIACGGGASAVHAQQADVIRGRITADDGEAVTNATIQLSSIPNNVKKSTKTDKTGRYTVAFPNGDGDYWVSVSAIGFVAKRFELKRLADEEILVADVKLTRAAAVLDAMQVRADRAKVGRNSSSTDISGTEKMVGNAAVDPNQAGNLAAMAAALPGVQLIPGADGNPDQFSVFGLSGDQNSSTLNGLGFAGADIPRDATTKSALGTSPWDVSRGGFSGGQLGVRTQSGSNFSARGVSSVATAPGLEWTDRAGRAAGAEYTALSLGAMTSGPIVGGQQLLQRGISVRSSRERSTKSHDRQRPRIADGRRLERFGGAVPRSTRSRARSGDHCRTSDGAGQRTRIVSRRVRFLSAVVHERTGVEHHGKRQLCPSQRAIRPSHVAPDDRCAARELVWRTARAAHQLLRLRCVDRNVGRRQQNARLHRSVLWRCRTAWCAWARPWTTGARRSRS